MENGKNGEISRIKTGFLDDLLEGGIPEGSIVALSGYPGTGKTIASIQILYNHLKNGGQGIYVTTEQRKQDILMQAKKLGMDLQPFISDKKLILMDPYTRVKKKVVKNGEEIEVSVPEVGLNISSLKDALVEAKKKLKEQYKKALLIIDSLSAFWLDKPAVARRESYSLRNFLVKWGFTTIVTLQIATSTDMAFGYGAIHIADGHIEMKFLKSDGGYDLGLIIWKMRFTKHPRYLIPYDITDRGISIVQSQ